MSDEKNLKLLYVRISFLADVVESSNELFHGRMADVLVIVSTMSLMAKVLASPVFQKIALGASQKFGFGHVCRSLTGQWTDAE